MAIKIGVIGLGEAGGSIAAGLKQAGADVTGFDARLDVPAVRSRAEGLGIFLAPSLSELAKRSNIILCLTHASSAVSVAREIAPHLLPQHVYSDWNSGGPKLKKEVASAIESSGAAFVDGAVMSAVVPLGHKVQVLLSGSGANKFLEATTGLGMNLEVVGENPGDASAMKMLRSMLVKGLEALILEFLITARKFSAEEKVLSQLNGTLPMHDWNELAARLASRSFQHGRRRAQELGQVAETLREVGIEPMVIAGAEKRLTWFADKELFAEGDEVLTGYAEILDRIEGKHD
jgi:3-hydroxyisobutyrate dehydrogenase-like beta-hydroxyacid dehydrogenase